MTSALRSLSTPPAPRPEAMDTPQANALAMPPGQASGPMGALPGPLGGVPSAMQGGMPQQPPQMPAPSHGQTVAALRHFRAIQEELKTLLADPGIGKSDMKSKIIDGVTKLVSSRMISPGEAVTQLATVPDTPFEQRKWLQNHMQQAQVAQYAVLSHHQQAFAGMPEDQMQSTSDPDNHMDDMKGLMGHYR